MGEPKHGTRSLIGLALMFLFAIVLVILVSVLAFSVESGTWM